MPTAGRDMRGRLPGWRDMKGALQLRRRHRLGMTSPAISMTITDRMAAWRRERRVLARVSAAALMKRPVEDIAYFETTASDRDVSALAARIDLRESVDASVSIELVL